jgi:hypothetical protein
LGFTETKFVSWLHDIIELLANRLDADIGMVAKEIGSNYLKSGEMHLLDTGKKPFEWTK